MMRRVRIIVAKMRERMFRQRWADLYVLEAGHTTRREVEAMETGGRRFVKRRGHEEIMGEGDGDGEVLADPVIILHALALFEQSLHFLGHINP